MVLYFIGVYVINRTLHRRLEMWNFSSSVEKIFHLFTALTHEIFSTLEEKFRISVWPCNILYLCLSFNIFVFCSRPRATSNTDSPQSPSLGTPVNSLGELIPPENSPRPKTPDTEMPLFPIKVNANELSLEEEQLANERKGRCLVMLI